MSLVQGSWKFNYDEALIVENAESVLEMGTLFTYNQSKEWYNHANIYARQFSLVYKKSKAITAGIISVLSPQKSWFHNLQLTREFLDSGGKDCGHLKGQVEKARKIYRLNETDIDKPTIIEGILGGMKTQNFFRNILDPNDNKHVTLDFHMCQLLTGNFDYKSPTDKQYQFLKDVIINFAKEKGRIPSQLQAELWLIWKENKHSKL